jgi:hypothetical protein
MKDFHTTFHFRKHLVDLTQEEVVEVMQKPCYTTAIQRVIEIRRAKIIRKHNENYPSPKNTDSQKIIRLFEA